MLLNYPGNSASFLCAKKGHCGFSAAFVALRRKLCYHTGGIQPGGILNRRGGNGLPGTEPRKRRRYSRRIRASGYGGCMEMYINPVERGMCVVGTALTAGTDNGDNFPVHVASYSFDAKGYVMVIDGSTRGRQIGLSSRKYAQDF